MGAAAPSLAACGGRAAGGWGTGFGADCSLDRGAGDAASAIGIVDIMTGITSRFPTLTSGT